MVQPEVLVRSMLHRAGYRFRKNVKELPGKPDIVLPKYRTVIFVHGCFWHRHKGCRGATTPKTRTEWWLKKFERNVSNDWKHSRQLRRLGWHVITVWECELKKPKKVLQRLERILTTNHANWREDLLTAKERMKRKTAVFNVWKIFFQTLEESGDKFGAVLF